MPESGLKVDDLSLLRGGQTVVSGIGFGLGPGRALELRGPNGAGKSSLLLALAGLIPVQTGTIAWQGGDDEVPTRAQLHYLGHHPGIKTGLTVRENLAFWVNVLGGRMGDIPSALDAAGLGPIGDFDAGVLSAGQGRRLALARLLAIPRPVWLLDEPTSALDTAGARWVGEMITAHLAQGGMAIIATHLDIDYGPGVMVDQLTLGQAA